jgi:hypothetical protein
VSNVVDAWDLDADEDRARHGRFSFHDRRGSTNRAGAWGDKKNATSFSWVHSA